MKHFVAIFLTAAFSAPFCIALTGCEKDFIPDRTHANRAVQSPLSSSDASSEARGGGAPGEEGIPLVSVGFPNHPGEQPQIRTAADNINDTFNPPSTQPASAPPATPTSQPTIRVDPIHGTGE